MFNVRLAGGHLYGKQLFTRLSLVVSSMASFVLSLFPLDVLDEIWDLIESVSEGFLTYSFRYQFDFKISRSGYIYLFSKNHCTYTRKETTQAHSPSRTRNFCRPSEHISLRLIESVSEGFFTYTCTLQNVLDRQFVQQSNWIEKRQADLGSRLINFFHTQLS